MSQCEALCSGAPCCLTLRMSIRRGRSDISYSSEMSSACVPMTTLPGPVMWQFSVVLGAVISDWVPDGRVCPEDMSRNCYHGDYNTYVVSRGIYSKTEHQGAGNEWDKTCMMFHSSQQHRWFQERNPKTQAGICNNCLLSYKASYKTHRGREGERGPLFSVICHQGANYRLSTSTTNQMRTMCNSPSGGGGHHTLQDEGLHWGV